VVSIASESVRSKPQLEFAKYNAGFRSGVFAGFLVSSFLFTIVFLIAFFLFAKPSLGFQESSVGETGSTESPVHPQRAVGEYRRDLKAFVRRSKDDSDEQNRMGAILDLCELHNEFVTDPRFELNDQIKGFRAVAASRLKNISKEIEIHVKRLDRERRQLNQSSSTVTNRTSFGSSSAGNDAPNRSSDQDELNVAANKAKYHGELPSEVYQQVAADDLHLLSQICGGPISLWGYVGGNFGGMADCGPELVRLIETTINPDFWRSNGGSGIIYYYQPLRILVVGATTQVHDEITNLLRTMRQMNQ